MSQGRTDPMISTYWIPGTPATFATAGERKWKDLLERAVPRGIEGLGLSMRFAIPQGDNRKLRADIDNFCEPVFSTMINKMSWLGGRRPNLTFWIAEKFIAPTPGLEISVHNAPPNQTLISGRCILEAVYDGPLPISATDTHVPVWLNQLPNWSRPEEDDRFDTRLEFADSTVNIGDIATGKVKSLIDCLYPVIGGSPGQPDDWKIDRLAVVKDIHDLDCGVRMRICSI